MQKLRDYLLRVLQAKHLVAWDDGDDYKSDPVRHSFPNGSLDMSLKELNQRTFQKLDSKTICLLFL